VGGRGLGGAVDDGDLGGAELGEALPEDEGFAAAVGPDEEEGLAVLGGAEPGKDAVHAAQHLACVDDWQVVGAEKGILIRAI